ncbi:DUF3667 domain-containing protein [Duganella violaceipulchra]|uniref:DUF3667 domain-containing protein n=1 Tax=Duganella violaceipulchra TaxID=2849652 RepID=A0AA41HCS8_9BURK|nr:DUF3667 domain-containing protein [Duganella violaceicalia]MBV6322264.1 DUF3667 domain-containing protein [Duganella violaceicalia]MCP2011411.1 hypothetical protein [Duganella violaceicalia]
MKFVSLGPRAHDVRPKSTGSCHDCAAPVDGKYCSQCGQSSHVHVASAGEFIHHFIGHFVAAEGKLWRTFGDLLGRPGQLTVDFICGRRTRHIDPLRLLLTVSMLVFGALKLQTHLVDNKQPERKPATVQTQDAKSLEKPLTTRLMVDVFERLSPTFREHLDKYEALPNEAKAAVLWEPWLKLGPTLILCLIPVVALFLKLLNAGTGWRYGEHLVFSMHLQTFALLDFLAWMLLAEVTEYGAPIALPVLAVYMMVALRRMYGGSWLVQAVRWVALVYLEVKAFLLMSLIAFFTSLL